MSQEAAGTQMPAVSRIARDIADGIILLDSRGAVQYVNPSARSLLGNDALQEGIPYARYMAADNNSANDDFHQYVLDSAYERSGNHRGVVTYTRPDGSVRYFSIETSFAGGEDGLQKTGVILQFSDITDLHLAKVKHDDTIKVLAGTILIMALWNFIAAIWESMGRPISSTALTVIIASLVFGAVHIHKGIVYMVGAALLLSFFGILYSKQKTIWGLCIPHLVLSWSLRILW